MRLNLISVLTCLFLPLVAVAQNGAAYSWVDDEGVRHFGDRIPAQYADKPKEVVNQHGVTIGHIEGKKSEEELAAERAEKELEMQLELQRRADRALLSTYTTIEEIEMHRDRRVELFQAQARVTELYLRNLNRRLEQLKTESGRYKPYNSDPNAPTIDPSLEDDIDQTKAAIDRHENNLKKFKATEKQIFDRFDGDIERFRELKGLTLAQTVPE